MFFLENQANLKKVKWIKSQLFLTNSLLNTFRRAVNSRLSQNRGVNPAAAENQVAKNYS